MDNSLRGRDVYLLKHRDDVAAVVEISETDASLISVREVVKAQLLPLYAQMDISNISLWWKRRAAPSSRSAVRQILSKKRFSSVHQFLLENLALSVTDCYWLCPSDADISWENVSFHENGISSHDPSASLGGSLAKRWVKRKGHMFLEKGNMPGHSFQQSLNEVFASLLHRKQNFDNYVSYELVRLKDGSTGCMCECFTNSDIEFVPAWEIFSKYGYDHDSSYLEQYVSYCAEEGVDENACRKFLDYQTMTDFLLTDKDRHLANFGLLRDSNTLECIGPAPIFDTGNSMFYDGAAVVNYRTMLDVRIQSLYSTERKTMENVVDPGVIHLDKVPDTAPVREFYEQDSTLFSFASRIADSFEFKCAMAKELQDGKSFSQIAREIISFYSGRGKEEKETLALYYRSIL